MLLANVVETSRRVAQTTRRLEKIDLLAALLRQLQPDEVETVVAFLSGYTRQGRIGVGYAALREAEASAAADSHAGNRRCGPRPVLAGRGAGTRLGGRAARYCCTTC